jgi:hypothetical protein
MTNKLSLPPLRDLPPGRLGQRKEHLLAEIERQERPAFAFPTSIRSGRFARVGRPGFVGAALVLAATVTLAGLLVVRTGTSTASAAEVRAKLTQALGRARSISGEFTVVTRPVGPLHRTTGCLNCYPAVPTPSKFVIAADGSYAEKTAGTVHTLRGRNVQVSSANAYDATTGVLTSYGGVYFKGRLLYVKATHIEPGVSFSPEAQLAAFVRQALATRNPRVHDTTFDGRRAWKLTLRFRQGTASDDFYYSYGVRVDVVVDRATGLVLQVTQYALTPNRWTSIESIRNLKIDVPTSAADFRLPVPAGARVVRLDYGFRRVSVSHAAGIVGYRPLLPTVTGGRPLVDFAVAKTNSLRLLPHGPGPIYRGVVSARYGRGLDSFVVSTRRGHAGDLAELVQGLSAHTVRLNSGPLKGALAYLSTSAPNPGYLAAFHNGLIVQVTATSANEAITIANSLSQRS